MSILAFKDVPPAATSPGPRDARAVKDLARLLGGVDTAWREADPVAIAGHAMDRTGIPLLRLILAATALVIIFVDPAEPDRHVFSTYATLALYTIYSAAVYIAASWYNLAGPQRAAHWTDVAWHTVLVSLSSGTNSLFFFFYFFGILVASFRCGRAEGLRVTLAAAILISFVGYATIDKETFQLNRFLMRPVSLGVLGYMIAYWGGLEHDLKRRLRLLREMTVLQNPRFGVHQTIVSALEKLRAFYHADACRLIVADDEEREHWLYQVRADEREPVAKPERCGSEMATVLLAIPWSQAMLIDRRSPLPWRVARFQRVPHVHVEDVVTGAISRDQPPGAEILLSALDADSVVTVPFRYHHQAIGRLYVTAAAGTFDVSDLEFLTHVIDATIRVTENVRLVDRLASQAADNERRRIARGIHDTVIQPYIGLQLGLTAIVERLKSGDPGVERDVERLLGLIGAEITRLRGYVTDLKGLPEGRPTLMSSVRRFARQYSEVTGIEVQVEGPSELALSERIASALFEMTTEALSNIRRHTQSQRASVAVSRTGDSIQLRVENEGTTEPFLPRSLNEHSEALGGRLDVQCSASRTAIAVSIPL